MLFRFLTVRVTVLAVILSVSALFVYSPGIAGIFGIALGAFVSLYKIRLFGLFISGLSISGKSSIKPAIFAFLSQILVFALLTVTIIADKRLFFGLAMGLLLVPLVICVNSVTEKTGLTHNGWGDKKEASAWRQ